MSADNNIYWEDVEIGHTNYSPARTMTETDIVNFAGLSGDFNIIHTDAEFSQGTPFGSASPTASSASPSPPASSPAPPAPSSTASSPSSA